MACQGRGATLDPRAQAGQHCTLPGFDRRRWNRGRLVQIHLGEPPRWDRQEHDPDWARPYEDIAREGCPAGWEQSGFVRSLEPYMRARTGDGGRVENPALTQTDDPLIHDANAFYERHENARMSQIGIETS